MNSIIEVNSLTKTYTRKKTVAGLKQRLLSLFKPSYTEIAAVKDIVFSIKMGDRVGFIGPNGAGKSTTIKILSGILRPTNGTVMVLGLEPWNNRQKLSAEIGTIFGQRSQLWYNLPVRDSFILIAKIYGIKDADFNKRLHYLANKFDIADLLDVQVRQLSFGQRMRCEIIASLLHNPRILFMDEPTIGLDVEAKHIIRNLIRQLAEEQNITLLLTSHDIDDIETICDKTIIINEGSIVFQGTITQLQSTFITSKIVSFYALEYNLALDIFGTRLVSAKDNHYVVEVDIKKTSIKEALEKIASVCDLQDIIIEDPPMEEIIRHIYKVSTNVGR